MSRTVMQEILDLRATAIALVGGAPIFTHQKLWQSISSLINDEGWCMEDAIHEVVVVRNEIATLLMPRPNSPQIAGFVGIAQGGTKGPWKGERKGGQRGQECQGFRRASQWPPDCHLLQEGSGEASSVQ